MEHCQELDRILTRLSKNGKSLIGLSAVHLDEHGKLLLTFLHTSYHIHRTLTWRLQTRHEVVTQNCATCAYRTKARGCSQSMKYTETDLQTYIRVLLIFLLKHTNMKIHTCTLNTRTLSSVRSFAYPSITTTVQEALSSSPAPNASLSFLLGFIFPKKCPPLWTSFLFFI